MKRILCFILLVAVTCSLCACGLPEVDDLVDMLPQKESAAAVATEFTELTEATALPEETAAEEVPEETAAEAVQIELSDYSVTLEVGDTVQLVGVAGTDVLLRWKSSNEAVAIVNSKGTVTAAGAGAASVTCYADGAIEAVCTVVVNAKATTPTYSAPSAGMYTSSAIFPHSSVEYLTREEVHYTLSSITDAPMSSSHAQDAINEIFARRGYVFKDNELYRYYCSKSWYVPNPSFDGKSFNAYEKANIELLKLFAY